MSAMETISQLSFTVALITDIHVVEQGLQMD